MLSLSCRRCATRKEKTMVNVNKLIEKIESKGISIVKLAKEIGVNPSTIYRRLSNPDTFTIKEVNCIVKLLSLSSVEAVAIFFSENVA